MLILTAKKNADASLDITLNMQQLNTHVLPVRLRIIAWVHCTLVRQMKWE